MFLEVLALHGSGVVNKIGRVRGTGGPSKKERGCLLSFLVPINFGNTNKLPLLGARPLDG